MLEIVLIISETDVLVWAFKQALFVCSFDLVLLKSSMLNRVLMQRNSYSQNLGSRDDKSDYLKAFF